MWPTPSITFVNGIVVGDRQLFDSIRIRGSRIDSLGAAPRRRDTVVDLGGSVVLPGLINAHDHLELNSFARLKWRSRYDNVREWIADFQPRFKSDPELAAARPETLSARVWVGGLKNMLSGVTTVCHHNPIHRTLRSRFPVGVVRRFGLSHSLQIDGRRVAAAYQRTPYTWPWIIHAAEGIDQDARLEIETLRTMGCLGTNTVLVHGVAIDKRRADKVLASGASLVWCPTSNHFLFGRTAAVEPFHLHGRLALGTDSRLSGEGDLLDELRAAHATRQLDPASLMRAVTSNAAAILRLSGAGRLEEGAPADLAVLRRVVPDPFETLVSATRKDVRLTMRAGAPLVAVPEFDSVFRARREPYASARVDGSNRLLAKWIARRASKLTLREPGLEIDA